MGKNTGKKEIAKIAHYWESLRHDKDSPSEYIFYHKKSYAACTHQRDFKELTTILTDSCHYQWPLLTQHVKSPGNKLSEVCWYSPSNTYCSDLSQRHSSMDSSLSVVRLVTPWVHAIRSIWMYIDILAYWSHTPILHCVFAVGLLVFTFYHRSDKITFWNFSKVKGNFSVLLLWKLKPLQLASLSFPVKAVLLKSTPRKHS